MQWHAATVSLRIIYHVLRHTILAANVAIPAVLVTSFPLTFAIGEVASFDETFSLVLFDLH